MVQTGIIDVMFFFFISSNVFALDPNKVAQNNQRAFDIGLKEFGIKPIITGPEMETMDAPDKIVMVPYLSQFYDYFRKECIRPAKSEY